MSIAQKNHTTLMPYWISTQGDQCELIKHEGVDVMGKESKVISPRGYCAGYEANYNKLDKPKDTKATS